MTSSAVSFDWKKLTDLSGHIALVTGGGAGLGLVIAKAFASNGAKVYVTGRRLELLQEAAALRFEGQGKIVALQMDVTDKDSIRRAADTVSETDGRLHILVNNAGVLGQTVPFVINPDAPERTSTASYGNGLFNSQDFQQWGSVYAVNTVGIFFTTSAFLGLLDAGARDPKVSIETASVINLTACVTAMNISLFYSMYIPSKTAAAHLTRLFATDFALKGIPVRVNAISPGLFPSDSGGTQEQADEAAKGRLMAERGIPLGRAGRHQELAALALYLVSNASSYTNGQEIVIDGGLSAVNP